MPHVLAEELSTFRVTPERGFLPPTDPLRRLPSDFSLWEQVAQDLPKLLVSDKVRPAVEQLPPLDPAPLHTDAQLERAMMVLSYLGHAYVWGERKPADRLPASLAVPWCEVARRLGRPPVLSYASYALHNWRRVDVCGPVALGNIALLQNFLAGQDEEWFILVHVDIEQKAAPAMAALGPAQHAAGVDEPGEVERHLGTIASALDRMNATMDRMPERCDPYVYYHRVRPYLYGWKNQPALPEGLVYEGVSAYAGKPQQFRGETGAQSSIVPSLDAVLGVTHRDDPLRDYLMEMRDYMPPAHRAFVEAVEAGPSVRRYVMDRRATRPTLAEVYNACADGVERFRSTHLRYAASYIHQQAQRDAANPTEIGTGGTPFMPYLKKHRDETAEHRIG